VTASLAAEEPSDRAARDVVLEARGLTKHFVTRSWLPGRGKVVHALDDIWLTVGRNETLGIVGESGCGKTTLARTLVQLETPTAGEVLLDGRGVHRLRGADLLDVRRRIQMVFQDPYASLSPRMTAQRIVSEGWTAHPDLVPPADRRHRAAELLAAVGLSADALDKYPHQFSGGQRQRIGIARALALDPEVLVCDEPTSGLDVSVQAQVLNLIKDIQQRRNLSVVFIGHDLSVVRHMSDRIAVMYLGRVVELGPAEQIFRSPRHPYTKALLSAAPEQGEVTGQRIVLTGDVPSPTNPPSGCRFRPRCWKAKLVCAVDVPTFAPGDQHQYACHFPELGDEL
jgi:oligopeptide transport system ATP-binding protein